jgi:hypothetical protein
MRVVPGPQTVRDQRNLMGFKHVSTMKVRLRHSNCLKSLKSLEEAPNTQLYESCEHPRNSRMWEFTLAKALRASKAVLEPTAASVESPKNGLSFATIFQLFTSTSTGPCPGHQGFQGYSVIEDE